MYGLKEILKLVEKKCFIAALDIKDVYYSIPVEESFQKYLKFVWKGILYQFCVLPNRLSPCPRWFTKLLKPPLAELRELKHDISAYNDDMYLQGNTKTKCVSNIVATIKILFFKILFYHSCRKVKFNPNTNIRYFRFYN